jgi:pimeloyl-ACP methyl ester carboxylesterase
VSGEAAEGRDANALFQMMPAAGHGLLDQMADPPQGAMQWFTKDDEDYFVEEFSRTGYFGPLSWYRNLDRNWETTPDLAGAKTMQPALFIAGAGDPVIRMLPPDGMTEWVPNLKGTDIVAGAGHWIHLEKPDEVNSRLLKFISDVGY